MPWVGKRADRQRLRRLMREADERAVPRCECGHRAPSTLLTMRSAVSVTDANAPNFRRLRSIRHEFV